MTSASNTALEPVLYDLAFTRLKIPRLIKQELLEAVKGVTFTPEQFYKYQEINIDNPSNHLYAMTDTAMKIHGFLWAEQNALDCSLFINTFSVSKQYWGKGKAIEKVIPFLDELRIKTKAPRVFWCTTNKRFFLKHGFKESKICLMEYLSPEAA